MAVARLIRPLRKALINPPQTLTPLQNPISHLLYNNKMGEEINPFLLSQTKNSIRRYYMSEMRKSAFKDNILRLIRNEIQYELDRSPPKQSPTKYESFTIDDLPGEQWIRLKRKFRENEEIKVEATMFDGAVPIPKSGVPGIKEDMLLHITLIINISKGDGDVLEILCSAWPDSIEITKLFIRRRNKTSLKAYDGPEFKELDDELQDTLYDFLEIRGINDEMAIFLHEYIRNKGKTEFIRWMSNVKSFIESK
ncbi:hypothetical protein SADUNF_Sadunf01G0035700 [Salix dunnii]|uniref:Mitochondrial glycoprotein family protein n=1 Tax=Salix dunnii TaxID=1413687 RepID=A0A835N9Q3_9ROSI|nr:hypothetical protein SADUNF_Sadunf01G0035700 [Salix dunnii]